MARESVRASGAGKCVKGEKLRRAKNRKTRGATRCLKEGRRPGDKVGGCGVERRDAKQDRSGCSGNSENGRKTWGGKEGVSGDQLEKQMRRGGGVRPPTELGAKGQKPGRQKQRKGSGMQQNRV